jgi:hypothetical protein
MRIALGTFARSAIEARLGPDLGISVGAALLHYGRRLRSGPAPVAFPRFRREERSLSVPDLEVELTMDAATRSALEREGERQGTSVGQLAAHAVLVYLADLDKAIGAGADSRRVSGQGRPRLGVAPRGRG